MLVDELSPLEEVLFTGHTGVVVRLLQAAVLCHEKQPVLLQGLLRAFHTEAYPKSCAPLFLFLITYEVFHGSSDGGTGKEVRPSNAVK